MTFLLKLILTLNIILTYAQEDEIIDDNVTRTVEVCEPVQVRHYKDSSRIIQLNRCTYGHGGIYFDEATAPATYYLDDKPFTGSVRENNGQFSFSDGQELSIIPISPAVVDKSTDLPSTFKCDGSNGNELQCLICNCFYETRGQKYEEQVMVARVVLSRVLNPRFSSSVCGVVHERNSQTNVAQFSWIRLSEENCLSSDCSATNLNYKINSTLGVGANYKNNSEQGSFNSCQKASLEALEKRNEYFASYYLNKKSVEEIPSWVSACEEKFPPGRTSNRISSSDLSHTFYRICEESERNFVPILLRPQPRPTNLGTNPATPTVRPRPRPTEGTD